MQRLTRFLGVVALVVATSAGAALAADGWSWYTGAEGSVSGKLGTLSPLVVSDAKGGEGLLPGETFNLKVDIHSDNRVDLTVVSVDIGDLKSGDATCDDSLENSRTRFDATPNLIVHPGDNLAVVLGTVRLPKLLSNKCQGRDVKADVSLQAAFGAS